VQALLAGTGVELQSMDDYPELPDVTEDGDSFLENALKKARTIAALTGEVCLADDSGLEVAALNGAPGIFSSRYAGDGADDRKNIEKLLRELEGVPPESRKAVFRCVLALCKPDGWCQVFDGRWHGQITREPRGKGGFGYDPVFFLPERGVTVAELPPEVKNSVSHRGEAVAKLRRWLENSIDQIGA
jgi:XTP/dITP diphosphohydrolase